MPGLVGWTLLAGMVVFLIGAAAWRLVYEQPLAESLRVVQADRRRRAWIHVWMIPALFITTAGLAGLTLHVDGETGEPLAVMATAIYGLGAVPWVVSLAFRLTVVPWAAERTVADDRMPDLFPALDAWAGSLYVIHMAASYVAFTLIGAAALASDQLPMWLGWLGVGWGVTFLAGFALTRAAGPFNPPLWAHTYTAVVGGVVVSA
jgi:hypothetical protein